MKKLIIIFGVIVAIVVSSTVFVTSCTGKKSEKEQTEGDGHQHAEGEEHEGMEMDSTSMDHHQIVYACPMHPEVTGKEGDKCSKCGMKLEAVKSSDSTEAHHDH
jgi:hypothetical protein